MAKRLPGTSLKATEVSYPSHMQYAIANDMGGLPALRRWGGRREKEQKSIARGTHSPGRPERRGRRGRRAFQGINLHGSNNKRVAPRSPILV